MGCCRLENSVAVERKAAQTSTWNGTKARQVQLWPKRQAFPPYAKNKWNRFTFQVLLSIQMRGSDEKFLYSIFVQTSVWLSLLPTACQKDYTPSPYRGWITIIRDPAHNLTR
jgi:hypothetical protein